MENEYLRIFANLFAAVCAGGLIGFDRSRRGRSAGFREHMLLCLGSCLLMHLAVFEWHGVMGVTARPFSREMAGPMIQGLVIGVGFLGTGGIMKEGLSVRGLTTAASLWVTTIIGIMIGVGFYFPAAAAMLITLLALTVMRRVEKSLAKEFHAQTTVTFPREAVMSEAELRTLFAEHGFSASNLSYALTGGGTLYEYRMVITTLGKTNIPHLARTLSDTKPVTGFSITPMTD